MLSELGFDYVDPMILHMDSQSAMALATKPTRLKRSKHIYIKYHWLQEYIFENNTVDLVHCATGDMVADVMTKALAADSHEKQARKLLGSAIIRRILGWFSSLYVTSVNFKESMKINPFFFH